MNNYFNNLNFRKKLQNLQKCRLMQFEEFTNSINYLKNKNIVIIGCGSQGLNQGLNMRDSGLNISYALKKESIKNKNLSWQRAYKNNFNIGSYKDLIPNADLIINLTPDNNHHNILKKIKFLMKKGATLGYSHGFNIIEEGEKIPKNITVIMVAPKCPGTEVREEFKRGFGVPALIAVHQNGIHNNGFNIAKAWAFSIGSHKAGVLESSFAAEVKSDLMGEQTVLCGMLQTASILLFDKLLTLNINSSYASQLIQFGWESITESLKQGGITLMMDRLNNFSKIRAYELSLILKKKLKPLFKKHIDNIISGKFSKKLIEDWNNNNLNLIKWRKIYQDNNFEKTKNTQDNHIEEQNFFDKGIFMISIIKSSIELSFDLMVESGIAPSSAYYESLHELPLIANTIARKKLYEMNRVISDTAEYGNYLFSNNAIPLLKNFINNLTPEDLGIVKIKNKLINNKYLRDLNYNIRNHPIEKIGYILRNYMIHMKSLTKIKK
ncbi:ketol-acid reductoisomerase [Enterobacteriaceae endosymbiont of Donacia bicoloricornis]|uniref:ketol-acid reductoisomerase n=1 Tax=Enterobacteriaceae endosymbiont of Donacia bicoloricornis TaxID=2675772 RepID=UPI001448D2F6|nr:ketol-acid reductoisomerase [Enterobacteriaceae endosymbiont of Donacia bicoloricornis]QJC37715.1 ketol-acid reductoisomerase [Enterobacteriaceae endosymbiont of Donacia bicoloricornis]